MLGEYGPAVLAGTLYVVPYSYNYYYFGSIYPLGTICSAFVPKL